MSLGTPKRHHAMISDTAKPRESPNPICMALYTPATCQGGRRAAPWGRQETERQRHGSREKGGLVNSPLPPPVPLL